RTVDRSVTGLLRRRVERGRRGSDIPVIVFSAPGRAVMACLVTAAALVLPVLVGVSVAFIVGVAQSRDGAPSPSAHTALAAGMVGGLLSAWWGPGGGAVRRGTRGTLRALTRNRIGAWGVLGALALVVVASLMVAGRGGGSQWTPLNVVTNARLAAERQLQ